ncbi:MULTISPECIES: S-formylglutathione hydrolase [Vibrio]|uniref:S-formylglutathione hydrolase n=1 Tax=Vibrio algicola TaxID=2662262 RepID=A0A5Q0THS1_9VIBR|nr:MULTISPECIES: S-formylglutathione hydrolase [Vibrio]MBD1576658.1 S-formylglutathione hydrolase [Vibrio sp. S11_S32]
MESLSSNKSFGGVQQQCEHQSKVLHCAMRFSVFLPPQATDDNPVPVLYWLSGLTCSDENFVQKAGAQRMAAELGIAIVTPDTSPRGVDVNGDTIADDEAYDLGQGAGFYLNATQAPWDKHYQMYDYIAYELPALIEANFPVSDKRSISGHSMGGHGALTIGLRNAPRFKSISAFSPIVSPLNCPWGHKALAAYLGDDQALWVKYDAVELMKKIKGDTAHLPPIKVSQGLADNFLEQQLKPHLLENAANQVNYPFEIKVHSGYDHSYFFISSFIDEHLIFHAQHLLK